MDAIVLLPRKNSWQESDSLGCENPAREWIIIAMCRVDKIIQLTQQHLFQLCHQAYLARNSCDMIIS